MRLAYHPNAATLSDYALDIWLAATVAAWPTVGAGTLISLTAPKYPFRIEPDTSADDRQTRGGKLFSKINFTRREAALEFPPISPDEVLLWRAFYSATKGFRKPFILEHPQTREKIILSGGQPFPFTLTTRNRYTGQVKWSERL